jgi:hypothetical protein
MKETAKRETPPIRRLHGKLRGGRGEAVGPSVGSTVRTIQGRTSPPPVMYGRLCLMVPSSVRWIPSVIRGMRFGRLEGGLALPGGHSCRLPEKENGGPRMRSGGSHDEIRGNTRVRG